VQTNGVTTPPTLRRALGRWDLTALGVNQVIGAAIFVLPSQVAAQLGSWSPIGFLLVGFASLLVALCFAEVGSRFDVTGGPYLYARTAFGRFVGFEVGWMQWLTRVTGQASVVNALALVLGFYWPVLTTGSGRAALIAAVTLTIGWINVRGIRHSAVVINLFTIGKLVPLAIFVAVGLWFIEPGRLALADAPSTGQISTGALLLIFAFGGFDGIGVPAGESSDPRRHVPFALVATVVAATAIMTLAQVVATGVLPDVARATTPIADASLIYMGVAGGLLVSAGSAVSMTGSNVGHVLTGSRMLFALAEHGDLPRPLARIHPRYRTPANAVMVSTAVALLLALSGSFATLAMANAIARLLIYVTSCLATLRLRGRRFEHRVSRPAFTTPFGPVVPVLATMISLAMLVGATSTQLLGGAVAFAAGGLLFAAARSGDRPHPYTEPRDHDRRPSQRVRE
jgi:amino acid transporter